MENMNWNAEINGNVVGIECQIMTQESFATYQTSYQKEEEDFLLSSLKKEGASPEKIEDELDYLRRVHQHDRWETSCF